MLSKGRLKYFNSLKNKKFRDADNLFVAEGDRLVTDLIPHFQLRFLVALPSWIESHSRVLPSPSCEIIDVTPDEMSRITLLNTPSPVYAVFARPLTCDYLEFRESIEPPEGQGNIILALDTVQDPGNLGTIIRTADWFGVRHILCSRQTADVYNPKVVQSTMGAIARVRVHYCDLAATLGRMRDGGWNVYGTFLDGTNIYSSALCRNRAVIVMGNEGNGISEAVAAVVNKRLLIPSYPIGEPTSESLNVSIATAIVLSEFRR